MVLAFLVFIVGMSSSFFGAMAARLLTDAAKPRP
jgi:hypothetical protein